MSTPMRHIPWCYSTGDGFGHHYITQDPALPTAEQFDIAIFPRGDKSRIAPDPLRDTPHIRIRTWDGNAWHDVSTTPIGRNTTPGTTIPAAYAVQPHQPYAAYGKSDS